MTRLIHRLRAFTVRWWNVLAAAALGSVALGWSFADIQHYPMAAGIAFAVAAAACVWTCRPYPLPAVGAAQLTVAVAMITHQRAGFAYVALMVCLYVIAYRMPTLIAAGFTAGAAAATFMLAGFTGLHTFYDSGSQLLVVGVVVAALAGKAARSGMDRVADAEARARLAEETREAEASRRVTEERLHIARELHDAVGHHIAVVNMQAGLAETVLLTDPDTARRALGVVREAAGGALRELAAMVNLLRDDESADTAPVAGLAQLPGLLTGLRSAGFDVQVTVSGERRELPAVADLTAFRVIQEALTNATKHGDGGAHLALEYLPAGLDISVTNGCTARRPAGLQVGGRGLRGMSERVAAVGGTFSAGAEGAPDAAATFRVHVYLPLVPAPGPIEKRGTPWEPSV